MEPRVKKLIAEDSVRLLHLHFLIGLLAFACSAASGGDRYPVRQLTTHPAQEGFPFWSPDGSRLVYQSAAIDDTTGLWTMAPDGSKRRRLTTEIGEHPTWSPDGHYIVFDGDSGNSIKIVSSRGGTPVRIVPDSVKIYNGGNPNWSPDGATILFHEGSSLRVLNLSRGTAPVLFTREGSRPISCCWSRDGKSVFFWLRPPGSRESSLWMVSLAGESREILPQSPGKALRYMDLSPDGSMIAYTVCEGRACDIWVMPSRGGAPVQLTTHPAMDESPRWSPDGTKIVFTSTRSQSFDVWVMDLDLGDLRQSLGLPERSRD
jgi:Tol biopolymer transport system component